MPAMSEADELRRRRDELVLQRAIVLVAQIKETPWIECPRVFVVRLIVVRGDCRSDEECTSRNEGPVKQVNVLKGFASDRSFGKETSVVE